MKKRQHHTKDEPPRTLPVALEDARNRHANERRALYFAAEARIGRQLDDYTRQLAELVERQTIELVALERRRAQQRNGARS